MNINLIIRYWSVQLQYDYGKMWRAVIDKYKFHCILYGGEYDSNDITNAFDSAIDYALPKKTFKSYLKKKWKKNYKLGYTYAKWRNIDLGVMDNSGHVVSSSNPKAVYDFLKRRIKNDNEQSKSSSKEIVELTL